MLEVGARKLPSWAAGRCQSCLLVNCKSAHQIPSLWLAAHGLPPLPADCNAPLLPDAAAHLARTLMTHWLPGALGLPTLRFPNWWGEEWLAWQAKARPALIFLTDLPTQGCANSSAGGSNGGLGPSRQQALHAYMLHTALSCNMHCAFMPELRFASNFVFGFRWRGPRDARDMRAAARAVGRAFQDAAAACETGLFGGNGGSGIASGSLPSLQDLGIVDGAVGSGVPAPEPGRGWPEPSIGWGWDWTLYRLHVASQAPAQGWDWCFAPWQS